MKITNLNVIKVLRSGENIQARAEWIREGGNFRIVLVDDQGHFENWMTTNSVVLVRPHVVFNYLRLRHKIACVKKNTNLGPCPDEETYENDFVVTLASVSEHLLKNARHIDSEEAKAADLYSAVAGTDVAQVRDVNYDGEMNCVALVSSDIDPTGDLPGLINSVATMLDRCDRLVVTEEDCTDGVVNVFECDKNHGEIEEAEEGQEDADRKVKENDKIATKDEMLKPVITRHFKRSAEPVNEFVENGLTIMEQFPNVFPLLRNSTVDG